MSKVVRRIAIALTVLSIIGLLLIIVFCALQLVGIDTLITSLGSIIIELILLWGLVNALTRIDRLEEILAAKKIVTSEDIEEHELKDNLEKICPFCGETLSLDEDICPNCKHKYKTIDIVFCKNCGYQLFSEDEICPNCQTPRDDIEKEDEEKLTK